MEIYITTMKILSLFGILTLILSMYIFIVVPTKMSAMFRAALIGNFLTSSLLQIYFSLGTIPSVLLPCCVFHTNGFMNYTGMSTFRQIFIQFFIFAMAGSFVALICMLRAVAVCVYMTERRKKQIAFIYLFLSAITILVGIMIIRRFETHKDNRLPCSKMFNNKPPPELFMSETLVVSIEEGGSDAVSLAWYTICSVSFYSITGGVSTVYLIWSLRMNRTRSSSSKALGSQHKLTLDVLKLVFFQMMGMIVPPIAIVFCIVNAVPSRTASDILIILLVINVNIACILMIRLIPAYKERLSKICSTILPVELIKRITKPKGQTVSVQSGVVRSTSSN